jgi:hypothetical protein
MTTSQYIIEDVTSQVNNNNNNNNNNNIHQPLIHPPSNTYTARNPITNPNSNPQTPSP